MLARLKKSSVLFELEEKLNKEIEKIDNRQFELVNQKLF